MKPATDLIHAGETDLGAAVPLTTPIYETATFVFENTQEVVAYNEGRSSKYLYSRYANPTVVSVERKLAALDRAETALLFSSGMGATATILMAHAQAGDEIVCSAGVYGGTLHLLNDLLTKFGLIARFVSLEDCHGPTASSASGPACSGSSRPSTRRCAVSTYVLSRKRAGNEACSR